MKILQLITRDNNRSGSGVQMMQLCLELARKGHAVTALYKSNPDRDKDFLPYQNSGVDLQRIDLKDTKLKASSLSDLLKIRSFIKRGNFDLVHSHSNAVDHAFLSTIGIDIPIFSNRGMCTPLKWKNALKYNSRKISQVIAVAESVKQVMHETGGVANEKISVVYGSVDVNRFHPNLRTDINRSKLGIENGTFVIGYTGSIGGRKGINYFIDAFRGVVKSKPNSVLLLVGITNQQLKDHGITIEKELGSTIKCLGFQHHPEDYMALFDLFVFPGTKSEGLTGAIREAAAMKIPIVTTDVGGNKELILNNETGIVVPPRDSRALTEGLLASIENYNHAIDMAEHAYKFVHENMTLQIRTRNILLIYERFVKNVNQSDLVHV